MSGKGSTVSRNAMSSVNDNTVKVLVGPIAGVLERLCGPGKNLVRDSSSVGEAVKQPEHAKLRIWRFHES